MTFFRIARDKYLNLSRVNSIEVWADEIHSEHHTVWAVFGQWNTRHEDSTALKSFDNKDDACEYVEKIVAEMNKREVRILR